MPSEKPRLHLDFTSPTTPPPTYSPYTYVTTSPTSPLTPRRGPTSPSSEPASPVTPRTPEQRIVMGAYVSTPEGTVDEEGSLEVPGIVLTEPARPATPRLPLPPPKQVVLLAPVSLPIPSSPTSLGPSLSARDVKCLSSASASGGPQFSPQFMAFLHPQPKRHNAKTILLVALLVLGGYHLWSTLQIGHVVEEAFEVL